jgi:hypothetical protein
MEPQVRNRHPAVMKTEEAWAADIRTTRHIGDFREWKSQDKYREAFGRFMRDLRDCGRTVLTSRKESNPLCIFEGHDLP